MGSAFCGIIKGGKANFKLDADTSAKIKDYIDKKRRQHDVEWFLIIAPGFASSAEQNALKKEKLTEGVNIRLMSSNDFRSLAEVWRDNFDQIIGSFRYLHFMEQVR